MTRLKKCTCCINDDTVRKISFDDNGVCNYCTEYRRIKDTLSDKALMSELFLERIENIRGKYDYDVALGISGGKDSIFVLYNLIHKYGLKVRTFTLNNGFLSDCAKANIDRLVKELGVEHEYIDFDPDLLRRFYRYSMKKWLTPCIACSYIGYAAMINYTSKVNAGICIHGRSPQQMLRYYGNDVFTAFVDSGMKHHYLTDVNKLYEELLKSIEDKMDATLMSEVREMLFRDVKENDFREFVSYFLYHPYDEKSMVAFLRENISWRPKEEYDHYDCEVHNAAHYIYQCAEGRPHSLPEVSTLVRMGLMSKDEAQAELKSKKYNHAPKEELHRLCDFVSLRPWVITTKARLYRRFVKK